jgi:capsular polysaccharide biosynthesis protein
LSPNDSRDAITAQRVAHVLWRQRLVCLAVALVILLGGSALVLTRQSVYQSSSSVALLPASRNPGILPNYPNLITSLIPTYVELVSSPVLLNIVAAKLPFPISEAQLANDVHAESLSNAAVINIVAQSANPVQAKEIASRATEVFLRQLRGNGVVIPKVYGQPTVSDTPVAPRTTLLLGAVVLLAVILGLGAGLAWDRLSGVTDHTADQPVTTRRSADEDRSPAPAEQKEQKEQTSSVRLVDEAQDLNSAEQKRARGSPGERGRPGRRPGGSSGTQRTRRGTSPQKQRGGPVPEEEPDASSITPQQAPAVTVSPRDLPSSSDQSPK